MATPVKRLDRFSPWGLAILLLLVTLLPRLSHNDYTLRSDEPYFFQWTNEFSSALLRGDLRGTLVGFGHPATTIFWIDTLAITLQHIGQLLWQGQAVSLPALAGMNDAFTLPNLLIRRWPIIVIDSALVALNFWLLTRLLAPRWQPALLGAIFLAFDPLYLAEARVLRTEVLASTLMLSAFLSYAVFLTGRGRHRYLWAAGVLAGLAVATRVSSLFVLGFMGLVGLAPFFVARRGESWSARLRWAGGVGLRVALPAAFVFWLLWPAMWVAPLSALERSASFAGGLIADPRTTYFLGAIRERDPLMLVYYPVLFLLRLTPPVTLGLALMAARIGWAAAGARARGLPNRHELLLGAALLAYALLYMAQMARGGHKFDHYLAPSFAAADVAAALGWWWLGDLLPARIWSRPALATTAAAVLAGAQAAFVLPYHPHYGAHVNALVGGPPAAVGLIELQAGEEMAARYLNRLPAAEGRARRAAVRTVRRFEPIFQGETIGLSESPDWARADYVVIGQYHLQRQIHDPQFLIYLQRRSPLYTANLGGLDYLWVYPGPGLDHYVGQEVEGKAVLLGFDREPAAGQLPSGESLSLRLLWQNEGLAPGDALFVDLVDPGRNVWAQTAANPDPSFEAAAQEVNGLVESSVALALPLGTPPGDYFLEIGVSNRSWQTTVGTFALPPGSEQVTVVRPERAPAVETVPVEHRLAAPATPDLRLVGYELPDSQLSLADDNVLVMVWQALAPLPDYALALQLRDEGDREVAYWLGRPVRSGYPTDRWQAGEIVRDPWDVTVPADVAPGRYRLTVSVYDVAAGADVNRLSLGDVTVVERRRRFAAPPLQHESRARWDGKITLLGYNLAVEPLTGGGQVRALLVWRNDRPLATNYVVFVHLVGPDGLPVSQHDSPPAGGHRPTSTWAAGEVIADQRVLNFQQLPAGAYRLAVGLYDPADGRRLPVVAGDGTALGDNLVLETITVK